FHVTGVQTCALPIFVPAMRLLLFFLAVLAASAQAQTLDDLLFFGQRSPAVGPRLTAMGGAATAGLGDWDAAYANPAGLAYLRSEIGRASCRERVPRS